jgi:hypothetical protein
MSLFVLVKGLQIPNQRRVSIEAEPVEDNPTAELLTLHEAARYLRITDESGRLRWRSSPLPGECSKAGSREKPS